MTDKSGFFDEKVYEYLLKVSSRESKPQQELAKEIAQFPNSRMMIAADQAQFLQFIIKLMQAKSILEIGMFAGYSALAMALSLPDDGELVTCELDRKHEALARKYWREAKVEDKIDLRIGKAEETLNNLIAEKRSFDFAFIDADKANYDTYYEQCLQLVRKGGVIAIDNVLWFGRLVQEDDGTKATKEVRALNEKLHTDSRVDLTMLPIGGGLTLLRKC